ncbi:MAG: 30S ribosomal protein S21 [Candidatus Magasanikbacteria bacterium]|nr:30S ribosomal protein S21 [Candidatus Magasanikbacteria bacterium]
MAEVKRKKGESFESLLRRFQTRIKESGRILQAKKIRFYARDVNKNQRRRSALEKGRRTQLREYLKKIGKLKEERTKKRRA